jgi:hypothetical protein
MTLLKFAGLAVALLAILGIAAHLVSAARFRAQVTGLVAEIVEGPETVSHTDLPPKIRRFAEGNIGENAGPFRAQRITQEAEFRQGPEAAWGPMPATQHIGLGAAGFVWDARSPGQLLPRFTVIDAYVNGTGLLRANLAGSLPVARATGPVIDRSEAMRYLAELAWAPDAILGNPDIIWAEREDGSVEAALDTGAGRVSVAYEFDGNGDIVGITGQRPDTAEDGTVFTREWRGSFSGYDWVGGRRIPLRGEVGYVENGAFWPYWRGEITGLELLR